MWDRFAIMAATEGLTPSAYLRRLVGDEVEPGRTDLSGFFAQIERGLRNEGYRL